MIKMLKSAKEQRALSEKNKKDLTINYIKELTIYIENCINKAVNRGDYCVSLALEGYNAESIDIVLNKLEALDYEIIENRCSLPRIISIEW